MNRPTTLFLLALTALPLLSCGHGKKSGEEATSPTSPVSVTAELSPDYKEMAFFEPTAKEQEPFRLCTPVLTTAEAMLAAFPDTYEDYLRETTPPEKAFYLPDADIRDRELVRTVQLRYNYVSVFYRVLHAYEWFHRKTIPIYDDEIVTKKDTLDWIRFARPQLPLSSLDDALPDERACLQALRLLDAYDRFDGDDSENSPFSAAMEAYSSALSELPVLVTKDQTDRFRDQFWDWYEKKALVLEIDSLARMARLDYKGEKPTEEQLVNMKLAIESERDIDRRTILALEYVKFDPMNGTPLLGEILESRIYTKYLLEAWIAWRANAQMEHSPSSFSVIANNYYDRIRTIVLDTMVRHCLQTKDENTKCLIENLIFCEIIHRMGSLAGNSSFSTVGHLRNDMFINPEQLKN